MEIGEIITYVVTALGGGGAGWLVNWKWGRRKEAASVKADEIENMRKAMADFYDPLVERQNKRIAVVEAVNCSLLTDVYNHGFRVKANSVSGETSFLVVKVG